MLLTAKSYLPKHQATMLVVIDPAVEEAESLVRGVRPDAEVLLLDSKKDSIAQITTALAAGKYRILHLVSHGSPACLHLGSTTLTSEKIPQYRQQLLEWGVTEILIYGCNVATGDAGTEFLSQLHRLTKANIQASSSKVGNIAKGGNWELDIAIGKCSEYKNPEIAFSLATQNTYSGVFATLPKELNLSDLNGSNGFVLNGINEGDRSGGSVSNAGDINGDGINDLIIGGLSESYLVFGSSNIGSSGIFELSTLNGSNGFVLNGLDDDDLSGISVGNAGDVNGDSIDDLIIGAPTNPFFGGLGESYVVFGGNDVGSSGTLDLSTFNGSNGFVLNGLDDDVYLGMSVSHAGDINDDGIDDLIIGAPNKFSNFKEASYVVFGGNNVGGSGTLDLSTLDGNNGFVLNSINEGDRLGSSVSKAGDINGDGIDDLIIGGLSESYLVFGSRNIGSFGAFELSALNGSNGFILKGINEGDELDGSVSHAGDINGDGIDDLIIGGLSESYLVFGSRNISNTGIFELSTLNGSNGFVLNQTGFSDVSKAGDINGDGADDLIIGASDASSNGSSSGESYVLFGGSNVGSSGNIDLSDLDGYDGLVLNGIDEGDKSGSSVSNAGDINGDGTDDLIIGAPNASPHGSFSGESYVVLGEDSLLNITINRFQNSKVPGTYLYAGEQESQNIRENYPQFIEEGQAFKVAFKPGDNLIRMNRFQNSKVPGTYLYAGEQESLNIRKNYPQFIEEGIAFYVYDVYDRPANKGIDIYRFQNQALLGTYLFVGSEERRSVLDNYPIFHEEGLAFAVEPYFS